MQKLLIIDGDFLLYKTCPNPVLTKEEQEQGVEPIVKSFIETCQLIDWYILEKIIKLTEATHFIAYLAGKGNFRYGIESGYKAGRSKELPPFFKEAKQYLVQKWGFVKVNDIEAEDAVRITYNKFITEPDNHIFRNNIIVVGQDHDLLQIESTIFNPVRNEWITLSKENAEYNFNVQQLSGCSTDKVIGLKKGIGEVKAKKLLENIPLDEQIYEILRLFIEEYGLDKGIVNFANNYKLLKILEEKEDFEIPEIQSVTDIVNSGKLFTDFNN